MKHFHLRQLVAPALLATALLLFTSVRATAEVRTWTDDLNRTWQGDFVRVDGLTAVFLVNSKEYPFPLAHLSASDKLLIFKLRQGTPPSPVAASGPNPVLSPAGSPVPAGNTASLVGAGHAATFGSVQVEPGKTVVTDLPLPSEDVPAVAKSYGDVAPAPTHIRASLAVPADFNADKPQKVLIVSATASGDTLSIPIAKNGYTKDALAHGYMVLAADGGYGKPKHGDGPDYRLILLKVALAELTARFPQAKVGWTFATAGFSGGCGYAGHQELWLSTQGYRVTGIMMLNCNYPPTMWEHDSAMRGNTSHWHQIPAFFSWGENDNVATPEMIKTAIDTTKHGGYQQVRAEEHPGHHQIWEPHVNLALDWFDSLADARH